MAHAGLRDRSKRMIVRKIDHFLVLTITWYLKLAYQLKFPGLPILQFLIVPTASRAGSLQIRHTLTITVHGLQTCENGNKFHNNSKSMHLQRDTFSRVWFLSNGRDREQLQIWHKLILKRFIKITLMLAKNCLAFRGHTAHRRS